MGLLHSQERCYKAMNIKSLEQRYIYPGNKAMRQYCSKEDLRSLGSRECCWPKREGQRLTRSLLLVRAHRTKGYHIKLSGISSTPTPVIANTVMVQSGSQLHISGQKDITRDKRQGCLYILPEYNSKGDREFQYQSIVSICSIEGDFNFGLDTVRGLFKAILGFKS